ncbi:uncharacterized protein K452DRAFT_228308 [Aplosporella prunicola CBS 121167]|uniref:ATP-grasp domain-containing protein n=1 Tax=Aplosporella prunicola CBS 121167 TaxID=1176127 RepID=A0A6A6BE76_9PEZI|nr:uncharacterized protein K452DRAFT_228308 [Aplosporella prunicola CBS 121167]KAF2141564.1 hypothetical protein K452DRAFT_228308 [Aplosporella prunicola CBS 121167]
MGLRLLQRRLFSSAAAAGKPRVAVLYQALEPPVINGVRKPKKPGGYRDSGADIAFVLRSQQRAQVLTPSTPDPSNDSSWVFPDHEEGILNAVQAGATHLWANTILFAEHPLQISRALDRYQNDLRVVGQPPQLVEAYDDKNYVNSLLRRSRDFTIPTSCIIGEGQDLEALLKKKNLAVPIVAKPIRGRGSHGVKLCHSNTDLRAHVEALWKESPQVMLEQYLSGEEATVTVMPPSAEKPGYWALPIVTRFNHIDGVAPYNGVRAVTSNSRAISDKEASADPAYARVARECEGVARLLKTTAPIRIDVRRFEPDSGFALFDINMKPNMTGPGRPGREDQASLSALAAAAAGWGYSQLLEKILRSTRTLHELRSTKLPV